MAKGEKIKSGIKKAGNVTAKDLVKYVALRPFKPMMRIALKKKGISTKGKNLKEVSEMFYTAFLMKGKKLETNFEQAYYENVYQGGTENFVVATDILVNTILSFIKNIQQKKKEGKPLTAQEKQIDQSITEAYKTQTNQSIGEYMPYILGGALLLVIVGVMLKK